MERKTMGSLMSALRKAKGFTQQDIADRLGVSNKTVSKWECGDGYPDISMLPAIAEIYSITVDELLKGEVNNANEFSANSSAKSNKQMQYLLNSAEVKFKNYSFLAFILGILSIVGAITVGFAFLRCYIALAVGSIFAAAAAITEYFALSKYIFTLKSSAADEIEFDKLRALKTVTRHIIMTSCSCISGVLFSIAGCIDADSYSYNGWYVKNPLTWLFIAFVCVIASLIISTIIKNLSIFADDEAIKRHKIKIKKFFLGFIIVIIAVTVAITGIDFVQNTFLNKDVYKFDNKTQFDAFIKFNYENEYVLYKTDYEELEAYVFSKENLPYVVNSDSSNQFSVDFDTEVVSVPYISSYVNFDFYEEYQSDINMDIVVFDTKEALDEFISDNDFISAEDLKGPLSLLINAVSYNEQELEVTYKLNYGSSLNIFAFVIIYVPVTIIYSICFELIWRRREKFNKNLPCCARQNLDKFNK